MSARRHGSIEVPAMAYVQQMVEQHGARQGIVILFDGAGRMVVKSYGATKAECAAVAKTCDAIFDGLRSGRIVGP